MQAHYFGTISPKSVWAEVFNIDGFTCIITRRSALPVRMSYKVNVLSDPILASTDDSDKLNRTAEIVSLDVGKVRLDIGALL